MRLCAKLCVRKSTRSSAQSSTRSDTHYYRVPAIFPIASTRVSAKYAPYVATLFFTLPSFLTSSLPREVPERQPAEDRCQNQTTIARTRRPSPEPDDHRQNQTTVARARRYRSND